MNVCGDLEMAPIDISCENTEGLAWKFAVTYRHLTLFCMNEIG
jgi:hypothetical protein